MLKTSHVEAVERNGFFICVLLRIVLPGLLLYSRTIKGRRTNRVRILKESIIEYDDKSYELTDETMVAPNGETLRRIRATKDNDYFGVKAGELGG